MVAPSPRPRRTMNWRVGLLGVGVTLLTASTALATTGTNELKAAMASFYGAMVHVVAADGRDNASIDPSLLRHMSSNAKLVARHFETQGSDAAYFARRVQRATQSLHEASRRGDRKMASRATQTLVESCTFCHARMPDKVDSPLTAAVMQNPALASLGNLRRAQIFGAFRQWDASSTAYASYFEGAEGLSTVTLRDDLVDFLAVQVRVKRDPSRAVAVLEKLRGQRASDPMDVRLLDRWIAVLRKDAAQTRTAAGALGRCRENAEKTDRTDDADMIFDVLAARDCNTVLQQRGARTGEAYLHLAAVEARLHRGRTPERIIDLYAAAIWSDPHSDISERALAGLEAWLHEDDAGSAGGPLSEASRALIDELAPLAERTP